MTDSSKTSDKSKRYPIQEDLIEEWLRDCDVSENTCRMYRCGLHAFQEYVLEEGLDFDSLQKGDVLEFKQALQQRLSPSTVSAYLAAVRSFYQWAENDSQPDIAHNVKGAKVQRGFKKDALSLERARELLSSIDRSSLLGLRDYAIINLMLCTALRDIEVVRADVGDIRDQLGTLTLYVQGKGHNEKDEFVVLTDRAYGPIQEYLAARGHVKESDPLFISCSNRNVDGRLTTRSVSAIVKKRLANIGIVSRRISAHSLRHTAVTFSLIGGASIQEAQEMARHTSVETTMIYSHNVDRIQNAAEYRVSDYLDFGEAAGMIPTRKH